MTALALEVFACWRCKGPRVKCWGIPCPACRVALEAEYDRERARRGVRLLYLPDHFDPPTITDDDEDSDVATGTRLCVECAREFDWEWKPNAGRPPVRCPSCRGQSAPAPVKRLPAPSRAIVPATKATAPVAVDAAKTAPLDIATIRAAVHSEIREIEQALSARLRLARALDDYAGLTKTETI